MSFEAIKFINVSKRYSPYDGLLKYKAWIDRIKNGHFTSKLVESEPFYALRDVSFEVTRGERVGVIGRNGAGKSTTLKLASATTSPTSGRIETNGKVGGVLELGSGFHPELTARENIFLQGTFYGIPKAQMEELVPTIIQLSDLGSFMDVPVKKFSSGMKVRLGFSVAVTTTPDIVLLDEVFAVGDAEFKTKSIKIMEQFLSGKTLFFVSHSLATVRKVCERVLVFDRGSLRFDGPSEEAIRFYNEEVVGGEKPHHRTKTIPRGVKRGQSKAPSCIVLEASVLNEDQNKPHSLLIQVKIQHNQKVSNLELALCLKKVSASSLSNIVFEKRFAIDVTELDDSGDSLMKIVSIDKSPLTSGMYECELFAESNADDITTARIVRTLGIRIDNSSQDCEASSLIWLASDITTS